MTALKKVITQVPVEIKVTEVSLLTAEEAEEAKRYSPKLLDGETWWLRSPAYTPDGIRDNTSVSIVYLGGPLTTIGSNCRSRNGVRPAITISNMSDADLSIGDEIKYAGYKWTVIPDGKALCNEIVAWTVYRDYDKIVKRDNLFYTVTGESYPLDELTDYDKSDIKEFLYEWGVENRVFYSAILLREHRVNALRNLWKLICPDDDTAQDEKELQNIIDQGTAGSTPGEIENNANWLNYRLASWLEEDIVTALVKVKFDPEKVEDIKDILQDDLGVDFNHCLKEAEIRLDYAAAFRKAKRGTDLSYPLRFRFGLDDLLKLLELHRKNKFRKKIEDLLEDCNFHHESGMLSQKKYYELESEIKEELKESA